MHSVKIKDLGKVVTGKTPPSAHPEYFGGTVPFLTPTDMNYTRRTETVRTISESGAKKFKNQLLPAGSTSFVCIGATIGKVTQNKLLTLTNQQINSLVPNDQTNPDYIYYALLFNKDKVAQIASGAATPIVNKTNFENVELLVHETQDQKKVALILAAYDDLIENNFKRIEKLESMARLLYDHHFKVPEATDWEELPLDEILTVHRGKSYKSSELSESEGLPFINLKCVNRGGGFRKDGLKRFTGSHKTDQQVEKGDLVMAVTDMTQDRAIVARAARVPSLAGGYGVISMDMVTIQPKGRNNKDYLYAMFRWSGFANEVKNHANGANVLHLLPARITDYKTNIPPVGLQEEFSEIVAPIFNLIDSLQLKNEALAKARDLLLPRLMSGEIEV